MRVRSQKVDRMLLAVLVAVLAAGWALALAAAPPAAADTLDRLTDRTHKMNMLGHLGYNPRLVFFGGSRSFRFEPSYARRRWGLRGFNGAVMESTHEDVWAMVHHLVRRAPKLRKYVVWGLQPGGFFTNKQFDVALIKDWRLRSSFPLDLRESMNGGMTHTWGHRVYVRDGAVAWDNYDRQVAAGVTLDASLAAYVERALKQRSDEDSIPTTVSRTRRYFEDTLAYMNDHDIEPLLLIMPIHPRVIRAIRDVHWDSRRASFRAYLVELQSRYHFTFIDFTFIRTFDGDPDAFYDGVHMKRSNMRRLLRAAVRKAPWAFGRAPAPWDVEPTPEPTPTPTSSGSAAVL